MKSGFHPEDQLEVGFQDAHRRIPNSVPNENDWRTKGGLCGASRYAWAVEEPVQPRDWAGMVRLARAKGLAIVLDESLTLLRDLDATPAGAEFVLNLRVSKLGGLKRTLRMLSIAKDRGLRVIIGAQVGETSILARAGIAAAAAAGASLAAYEGGYGTWLLKRNAVTPSLNFGHGGRLSLKDAGLESIGTGLRPTAELLSRLG